LVSRSSINTLQNVSALSAPSRRISLIRHSLPTIFLPWDNHSHRPTRYPAKKRGALRARRRIRTGKVCFFIFYGFEKFDMLEWTPARGSAEGS
jgi:hypothetical protein